MKQGQASRSGSGSQKVEPKSEGINPGAVSYLGNSLGNHAMEDDKTLDNYSRMNQGRGYHAPGIGSKTHNRGSQGSY